MAEEKREDIEIKVDDNGNDDPYAMFDDLDNLDPFDEPTEDLEDDARTPIDKVLKSIKRVIHEDLNFETISDKVGEKFIDSMPSVVKEPILMVKDTADELIDKAKGPLNQVKKQVKSTLGSLESVAPEALGIKNLIRKLKDKITVEGESASFFFNNIEKSVEEIAKEEAEKAYEDIVSKAKEEIQQATLQAYINKPQQELLAQSVTELAKIRIFMTKITANYYRKSLELQFRHLLTTEKLYKFIKTDMEAKGKQLESIVRNTALPDIVKTNTKEYFTHLARQKAAQRGIEIIKGSAGFQKLITNLKTTGENLITETASKLSGGGMISDVIQMAKETGGNPLDMLMSQLVDEAMKRVTSPVTELGKRKFMSTRMGNRLADVIAEVGNDPKAIFEYLRDKYGEEEAEAAKQYLEDESFKAKLKNLSVGIKEKKASLAKNIFDILANSVESSSDMSIKFQHQDPESPTHVNVKTIKAITEVIPNLLAKILAEVSSIRIKLKAPTPASELVYDYNKEKFVTVKDLKRELQRYILDTGKTLVAKEKDVGEKLARIIHPYGKLEDQELAEFTKHVTDFSRETGITDLRILVRKGLLDKIKDENLKNKIIPILNAYQADTSYDKIEKTEDLINELKSLKETRESYIESIARKAESVHKLGRGDILEDLGLVNPDDHTTFKTGKINQTLEKIAGKELVKGTKRGEYLKDVFKGIEEEIRRKQEEEQNKWYNKAKNKAFEFVKNIKEERDLKNKINQYNIRSYNPQLVGQYLQSGQVDFSINKDTGFKQFLSNKKEALENIKNRVYNKEAVKHFYEDVKSKTEEIKKELETTTKDLTEKVKDKINEVEDKIKPTKIKNKINEVREDIKKEINKTIEDVKPKLEEKRKDLNDVVEKVSSIKSKIEEKPQTKETIKSVVKPVVETKPSIRPIVKVSDVKSVVEKQLQTQIPTVVETIKPEVIKIKDIVKSEVPKAVEKSDKKLLNNTVEEIKSTINNVKDKINEEVKEGVKDNIQKLKGNVSIDKEKIKELNKITNEKINSIKDKIYDVNGITVTVTGDLKEKPNTITNLFNRFVQFGRDIGEKGRTEFNNIRNKISEYIKNNNFKGLLEKALDNVKLPTTSEEAKEVYTKVLMDLDPTGELVEELNKRFKNPMEFIYNLHKGIIADKQKQLIEDKDSLTSSIKGKVNDFLSGNLFGRSLTRFGKVGKHLLNIGIGNLKVIKDSYLNNMVDENGKFRFSLKGLAKGTGSAFINTAKYTGKEVRGIYDETFAEIKDILKTTFEKVKEEVDKADIKEDKSKKGIITKVGGGFVKSATTAGKLYRSGIDKTFDIINSIKNKFTKTDDIVKKETEVLEKVSESTDKTAEAVKELTNEVKKLKEKPKANPFDKDKDGLRDGSWQERLKEIEDEDKKKKTSLKDKIKNVAKTIKEKTGMSFTTIALLVTGALSAMGITGKDVRDFIKGVKSGIQTIGKVIKNIYEFVKPVLTKIGEGISATWEFLKKAFIFVKNLPDNFVYGLRKVLSHIPGLGSLAPSKEEEKIHELRNKGYDDEQIARIMKGLPPEEKEDEESRGSIAGKVAVGATVAYGAKKVGLTKAVNKTVKATTKIATKALTRKTTEAVAKKVTTKVAEKTVTKKVSRSALKAFLSRLKTIVLKKFGPKVGARLLSKIALRFVPIAGWAMLAYDAAKVAWYMFHDGMSFKSAVSKQILGFDIFKDDEVPRDENGEPIKPDVNKKAIVEANKMAQKWAGVKHTKPINKQPDVSKEIDKKVKDNVVTKSKMIEHKKEKELTHAVLASGNSNLKVNDRHLSDIKYYTAKSVNIQEDILRVLNDILKIQQQHFGYIKSTNKHSNHTTQSKTHNPQYHEPPFRPAMSSSVDEY